MKENKGKGLVEEEAIQEEVCSQSHPSSAEKRNMWRVQRKYVPNLTKRIWRVFLVVKATKRLNMGRLSLGSSRPVPSSFLLLPNSLQ